MEFGVGDLLLGSRRLGLFIEILILGGGGKLGGPMTAGWGPAVLVRLGPRGSHQRTVVVLTGINGEAEHV
ncbi:MAG: hypothetical protein OSB36_07235 [Longimicrobiales bacterium]|nr:hypothetical protein [Longimicrobiales bacterium]